VNPLILGVAGGTGSGKTTLAENLVASLPAGVASLIAHDWYYRCRKHLTPEERNVLNFDEPGALDNELLVQHLRELRAGKGIRCPQYDFATHTRRAETRLVAACPIVVVEGILILSVPELRAAFDLKVFVDTDHDVRVLRRLRRDIEERGRDFASVQSQYLHTVRPMHLLHVEPARYHADVIIPEGGENTAALSVLTGFLQHHIATQATEAMG
jgi:uridine kinase